MQTVQVQLSDSVIVEFEVPDGVDAQAVANSIRVTVPDGVEPTGEAVITAMAWQGETLTAERFG